MDSRRGNYKLKKYLIIYAIILVCIAIAVTGTYFILKGNDRIEAFSEHNTTSSESTDNVGNVEQNTQQENVEPNVNNENTTSTDTNNTNTNNTDNTNTTTNNNTSTSNIQEREVVDTITETVEKGTEGQYLSWTIATPTIGEILPDVETATVEVAKRADKETANLNDDITYTITISSNKELENVSIKDLIPEMTTLKSVENNGKEVIDESGKVIALRWEVDLNEENQYTAEVKFTVTVNEDATGIIVNSEAIANGKKLDNPVEINILSHILFVENGGTDVEDILNKNSNTTIENRKMPTISKVGYVFAGWYDNANFDGNEVTTLPKEYVAGTTTYYAKWTPATDTKYTVRHWKENIADNGYTEVETDKQILTGTTEDLTVAVAKDYTGFTVKEFNQAKILPDGSTIVDIYYNRNVYTITYNIIGTKFVQENYAQQEYKYEANITLAAEPQVRVGYTFSGWSTIPATMPANHLTIEGQYNPNTDTAYIVNHYQQNANDNGYTLVKTDNLTGTTDEQTKAVAEDYTGFTVKDFEQDVIKPDGSTVINIYYDRNVWTITYKVTGRIDATEDFAHSNFKYGQDVTPVQTPSKIGYTFIGWADEPTTMPNNNVTVTGYYQPNTDTKYKVEHYKQNIENDEYTLFETENLTGTTDELTKAVAKNYEGFMLQSFNQENIAPDGSTVITIKYNRNKYTLNYKIEGSLFATNSYDTQEYKYEAPVTALATPDKVGYTFGGWYEVPTTMPAHNVTVKGNYSPNSDTAYTVKHLKQNVDNDEYTEVVEDKQTLTGITGATTNAVAKTYAGFTAQIFEQKEIQADGSTVIEIKYSRNNYKLIYKIIGSYFSNDNYETQTYRYGKAITEIAKPEQVGFDFFGWNNIPQTMPANDVVVTGNYTPKTDTKYTVNHIQENANDDGYTTVEIEELTGTTLNTTNAVANTYEGFTVQNFNQEQIKADGSTVVNIYYKRNVHTIVYNIVGNYFKQDAYATQSYKYGQNVTAIDTLNKTGYNFKGWRNVPITMPNEDVIVEGNFVVGPTTYTVKHMLQNIDDNNYTEDVSARETLDGITEDMTNAVAKTYEGFTAQTIIQVQIQADGNTVVEVRYNRNDYTITYKIQGFYNNNDNYRQETYRYGKAVVAIDKPQEEPGYTFEGWFGVPKTMPANNVIARGYYEANRNTPYTVKHMLQNIDDNNYTEDILARENLTGTTDTIAFARANTYEGFTAQSFELEKIKGDGSTVIEIYYNRNVYTITYKITGEHFATNGNFAQKSYKYGATIEDVDATNHIGYEFSGWKLADNNALPETMPANNLEVQGYYTPLTVAYKVEHYKQNIADNEYTLAVTEDLTGLTGAMTKANAKNYVGFTVKDFEQKEIKGDGSTVIKIYYTRNTYTIIFHANADEATGETSYQVVKFEEETILNENKFERYNYEFKNWNIASDATGSSYENKANFQVTENNIAIVNNDNIINLYAQWTLLDARFMDGNNIQYHIKKLANPDIKNYWTADTSISNIERTDEAPTDLSICKNVSITETPIYMWLDEEDTTKVLWYTKDPTPELNADCSYMFYTLTNLTSEDITNVCSTSNVTDMHYMFSGCRSLTNLDVSSWDTSNVTNMQDMFGGSRINHIKCIYLGYG